MSELAAAEAYRHLGLHSVEIYVRDANRSAAFFAALGFTTHGTRTYQGREVAIVSPPNGGLLVLVLLEPEAGSGEEHMIGRRTGLNFLTNDIAGRHQEWVRCGVRFLEAPTLGPVGATMAEFLDLDGNVFRLAEADAMTARLEADHRAEAARLERERHMAREMEIARQVQGRLFPQAVPAMRQLECAGACWPAQQVGGDYYDFLPLDDTRLAIVIGDVAGKGIAAALLMAGLQASVRGALTRGATDLPALIEEVNRAFFENSPDASYATLFLGIYDDRSGALSYANCGHLPPLLLRSRGDLERLQPTGTILGMFAASTCHVGSVVLNEDDLLVLYTDGASEARNPRDEEFGEAGILAAAAASRSRPATDVLRSVADAVTAHSGTAHDDDVTLIVARRLAASALTARRSSPH